MTKRNLWMYVGAVLAIALFTFGCGGGDGGTSAEDMARISDLETASNADAARIEMLQGQIEDLEGQLSIPPDDDVEETIEALEARLAELRGRVDQEGFPSTDPQNPTTGPQVDIGVEHVSGLTEMAGDMFITNSPIKSRITPSHYLSESYDTERRHHGVALINGTAAVGFGGRQYLDDAETYGGWMEFNHFGVFPGTDDDGRPFTDLWSIGDQSGSNPTGTELEWNGAFVGQEMMHADNMGDRMRGSVRLRVMLGDPLAMGMLQIDRAQLLVGGTEMGTDIVNIDNSSATVPYPYGMLTGVAAAPGEFIIPVSGGKFEEGSDTLYAHSNAPDTDVGTFTIEGSFYGDDQQEAGGIFSFTDNTDGAGTVDELAEYHLIGAFGADRRGN